MKGNDTTNLTFDCFYKVLLVGDSSVGKTSFIRRYIDNIFSDKVLSTMGMI
jgi:GTPase SAR1 family protein